METKNWIQLIAATVSIQLLNTFLKCYFDWRTKKYIVDNKQVVEKITEYYPNGKVKKRTIRHRE